VRRLRQRDARRTGGVRDIACIRLEAVLERLHGVVDRQVNRAAAPAGRVLSQCKSLRRRIIVLSVGLAGSTASMLGADGALSGIGAIGVECDGVFIRDSNHLSG
jgi:hypothetical protein